MVLFCVCRVGSEACLKREVARERPDWRLAFSRPGFVTFRTDDLTRREALDLGWQPVFAQRIGIVLGTPVHDRLPDPEVRGTLRLLAKELPGQPLRLHVFPMGPPHDRFPCPRCMAVHDELAARAPEAGVNLLPGPDPEPGDLVADVATSSSGTWSVGLHRHRAGMTPWPGGSFPVMPPLDVPSDGWLKLEESLRWSGLPVRRSQTVLAAGCAPGGASLALLQRGLDVICVDPQPAYSAVADYHEGYARFTWIPRRVEDLAQHELPRLAHWLLIDIDLAPNLVLPLVERLVSWTRPALLGLMWMVKMTSERCDERIPALIERVRALGLEDVRCAQLSTHRREVLICGGAPARPKMGGGAR